MSLILHQVAATETDLQEFLDRTGSSPENLALQELLEKLGE